MMILYIRYQKYALAVMTDETEIGEKWLKITKMYQLLSLPPELIGEEKEKAFKMLKFDIADSKTYSTPWSSSNFWINISDASEISELMKIPDHPDITEEEIKILQEKAKLIGGKQEVLTEDEKGKEKY